jgi:hypothetical protein
LAERLAAFRDRWLQEPNLEEGPPFLAPADMIESERRRLPIASDGSPVDPDCPICQSLAEGEFGPAFLGFDGHHLELEDEFAFSLCRTREEWEREQEDYRRFAEEMDRKREERAAAGEDATGLGAESAWQTSFVDWDAGADADRSPLEARLALGFPLAELVSDLRDRPGGVDLLRSLNRAFAGFRRSNDAILAQVAGREFCQLLEAVARQFPDLTAKCADLQSRVDEVLRQLSG